MRTLILGAGFGGLTAAVELKRLAPDEEVMLVDERASFLMGTTKLWILDGRRRAGEGERAIADVARHGVRVVQARAESVDAQAKRARVGGQEIAYDRLVLALGARLAPEDVPGLAQHARNLYAKEGVAAFHEDLARLRGGRVLVLVTATPFKCPPAPYEAAMLAKRYLDARGVDAQVTIASPEPQPLPIAGKACGDEVRGWVEERGVRVLNGKQVARIEPSRAIFADGSEEPFDALAAVPPHKPPPLVAQLFAGWAPADAHTAATSLPDVWAVGDCNVVKLANGKPLVKAGVMAEGEASVVARRIAGDEDARFDGKGVCFLELGDGLATEVAGDFYATPNPIVAAKPPTKAALEAKRRFESERFAAWFGRSS
ncbi:MAG: sulfide:quinone oxidoreductase [Thermoplasmata archaeon]|jgi:sulfide:quinone oxidoreductase|nr:sulfide:quinone oxidoreductase [Thermoplasmata archaeon]